MTASDTVRAEDAAHCRDLGRRLREVRVGLGLSLREVEEKSHGEWIAVVVGAAERGDRRFFTCYLMRIAKFYGVDPAWLLTGERPEEAAAAAAERARIIDLIGARR